MSYDGAELYDDNFAVLFRFGPMGSWKSTFYLSNLGIVDHRRGAIDEFVETYASDYPLFPGDFRRIRARNTASPTDEWGLAGLKFEIMCFKPNQPGVLTGQWYTVYTNRGVNEVVDFGLPNVWESTFSAAPTYNGDHEVFWLVNVGDHNGDGEADDLATCHDGAGNVRCQLFARVEDSSDNDLHEEELTNSWWDANGPAYVNPFEHTHAEQHGELGDTETDDEIYVDNFWRWFWTSEAFTHADIHHARLVLDNCTLLAGTCSMQTNYLHTVAMHAWGKFSASPLPKFPSHVYDGDFGVDAGWLEVGGAASDSVATSAVHFVPFGNAHWRVEAWQDSEHMIQQYGYACGYMSADMILSTRGFAYENIPPWPPYDGAVGWQEAAAIAHLEWGYKTMCCGTWNCCPDVQNCVSNINLDTDPDPDVCDDTNFAHWWTWARCQYNYPGGNEICMGSTTNDRYFWRDANNDSVVDEAERFPHLIDYNGVVQWTCRPTEDDDDDGFLNEGDHSEFWSTHRPDTDPATEGIKGATNRTLAKFLTDQDTSGSSDWSLFSENNCGIDPVNDLEWFGNTMSVTDGLKKGYGMYFWWNNIAGHCGGAVDSDTYSTGGSHYSVLDGFERIYHPGGAGGGDPYFDFLFFIGNPMGPYQHATYEYTHGGLDSLGFTAEDFENTVKGVTMWNYDHYL